MVSEGLEPGNPHLHQNPRGPFSYTSITMLDFHSNSRGVAAHFQVCQFFILIRVNEPVTHLRSPQEQTPNSKYHREWLEFVKPFRGEPEIYAFDFLKVGKQRWARKRRACLHA